MEYGLPDVRKSAKAFILCLLFELVGTALWVVIFNHSYNDYGARAGMYFVTYIMASTISGAHFNPAISLAVYLAQRKYRKLFGYLIAVWAAQLIGAFVGVLLSYMILFHWSPPLFPDSSMIFLNKFGQTEFVHFAGLFPNPGTVHYLKLIWLEATATFFFTCAFLSLKFKAIYITSDEILKALLLAIVLYSCFWYTAGTRGCLNPWFGFAQNVYYTGLINGLGFSGGYYSNAIWVYIFAPFLGAILAPFFLRFVSSLDRVRRHEESPIKAVEQVKREPASAPDVVHHPMTTVETH